ncbi:hypothetical protein DVJ77_19410 [Dyella tabacisoli]|uniref:Barstar (barnase inhibitor) domain-containing protein n=1 Tax=Dyella tabacisoli TaxID=2282381 RepID=A0A369UH12_9GAMM|nr:hypothetical protein DVJ77_19410 [Dyella tabacisoli]
MDFAVQCADVGDEAGFWQAYLDAVRPEGATSFGCNMDAFRDAILGGGPGWPGECVLRLMDFDHLRTIGGGHLCRFLRDLAVESRHVTITFE